MSLYPAFPSLSRSYFKEDLLPSSLIIQPFSPDTHLLFFSRHDLLLLRLASNQYVAENGLELLHSYLYSASPSEGASSLSQMPSQHGASFHETVNPIPRVPRVRALLASFPQS